jgi:hypothetical protein
MIMLLTSYLLSIGLTNDAIPFSCFWIFVRVVHAAAASRERKKPKCNKTSTTNDHSIITMAPSVSDKQCEVVLVGCGAPLRGMGW